MKKIFQFILNSLEVLLSIDSPTGLTIGISNYIFEELLCMGYKPIKNQDDSIFVNLNKSAQSRRIITAHMDTIGAMISASTGKKNYKLSPIGGLNANNIEAENCCIITRNGKKFSATIQLENASVHVNNEYNLTPRTFNTIEVVPDMPDIDKSDVRIGDFVAIDPKLKILDNGYIKSRFLDDKLGVAILLGLCKFFSNSNFCPDIAFFFATNEETGNGCAQLATYDFDELVAVDMGCVGEGLSCSERQVSICVKDSSGPYNYNLTNRLINLATDNKINYAVDIYPFYKSDASVAIKAGANICHALIGPGVYASHGYERSHLEGVQATYDLLNAYIINKLDNCK